MFVANVASFNRFCSLSTGVDHLSTRTSTASDGAPTDGTPTDPNDSSVFADTLSAFTRPSQVLHRPQTALCVMRRSRPQPGARVSSITPSGYETITAWMRIHNALTTPLRPAFRDWRPPDAAIADERLR